MTDSPTLPAVAEPAEKLRKVHPHMPGDASSGMYVCGGSGLKPEAQRELDEFRTWLMLPKPRTEFRAWCAARQSDASPLVTGTEYGA